MELEQLKKIWEQEDLPEQKKHEQWLLLMGKRSNNPIARMKRNLQLELFAVIVLYGAAVVYYFIAFHGKMQEASWFMIGIAIAFFIYYFKKRKLLNEMQCLTCHVKSNLQQQMNILEKYIRFYLAAGTALVPLTMLFFSWLAFTKFPFKSHTVFFPSHHPLWETVAAWTALISGSTVVVYYLNKWYIKKLYGEHISKLKHLVAEMEEEL